MPNLLNDAAALTLVAKAFDDAAQSAARYVAGRRAMRDANTYGNEQLSRLLDDASAFPAGVIPGDRDMETMAEEAAAAGREGRDVRDVHTGGFITVAYAEQLVTAYAALIVVMATPNVSPWAYNEANRSMAQIQRFWQILGFMKYGSIESLARAKVRGPEAPKAGGKPPTPGATAPKPPADTLAARAANGSLRW